MASREATHVLDNAGWHAMNTRQARFAIGTTLAKRFAPGLWPIAALADSSDAAFSDLRQIVGKGEMVALLADRLPADLPGWTMQQTMTLVQMVSDKPVSAPESAGQVVNLTESDVAEMQQLVELTHPGPFFPNALKTGRYLGIRQQGQLVAMVGERLHLTGYHEISTVCTHPDHQGKGYGRRLVSHLGNANWESGDAPFLHVVPANERAIRLYEALHFQKRCEVQLLVMSRE